MSGRGSVCPASYLEPEGRVLFVQTPPTSMLVLCVKMPGPALLEIMDDLRQNVSCMTTDGHVTTHMTTQTGYVADYVLPASFALLASLQFSI